MRISTQRWLKLLLFIVVISATSFSGNLTATNTPYNNGRKRNRYDLWFIKLHERQQNDRNLNAKLTWDITGSFKTALSYHGSWKRWTDGPDLDWLWRDYPR